MIKKTMSMIMVLLLLLSSLVLAGPPTPMPFVTYYDYNGPVIGMGVSFTCGSATIIKQTNEKGGILVDLSDGGELPCNSILTVACGYTECNKQYNVNSLDFPYEETYVLVEAPVVPEPDEPEEEETVDETKVTANTALTIAYVEANFGETLDFTVEDNKLSKLLDEEIDFDTEDYNIHEEVNVKGKILTSIDDDEFGTDVYLAIEEEGITYKYIFDDALPLVDIEEDEELEIVFLGEDLEIIRASSDEIVIRHGELKSVKEGETVEGIKIVTIGEDFIFIERNGVSEKIYEGSAEEVGGIEVYLDEAVEDEDVTDSATIRIADDVEVTIQDGEDYKEGDTWKWIIDLPSTIGITNQEAYDDLDEDTKPLKEGDMIELPNKFTKIKFDSVTTPKQNELSIKIKDTYLRITGDIDVFDGEYDEVLVGDTGVLDEDEVLIGQKVRIGDSDVYLEKGSLVIGDLKVELGFLDILYKGVSFDGKDETYMGHEGLIFINPDDSINDESTFEVSVPDEVPEVKITIGEEEAKAADPDDPVDCPRVVTCPAIPICPTCVDKVCPPVNPPTCNECPNCENCVDVPTCPVIPPDGNAGTAIIAAIGALLGAGIGIYFTKNKILGTRGGLKIYKNRKGEEVTLHTHPGIRGYHDPKVKHQVDKEEHPRGQLLPHYEKDDSGEWAYRR